MQTADLLAYIGQLFDQHALPALERYIRIPNRSPAFDPAWREAGHMKQAVDLIASWCRERPVEGLKVEVIDHEGRTPLILMEVPARGATHEHDTVLLYGHLDKQPEMTGWSDGLGPWTPVFREDRLYGRGGADDGYSAFSALAAIEALQRSGQPHARCLIMIEASEESGSPDLPYYVDLLKDRIGQPSLIVCLDSGCGDYERLWCTTSLRGMVIGELRVRVLSEGVHSGDAGGIVPSTFRIIRQLLSRIEDQDTGEILLRAVRTPIPEERRRQAQTVGKVLAEDIYAKFPFETGVRPVVEALDELVLNRTWRAALEITGASGLPDLAAAGNVARPETALKLSLRLPPNCPSEEAYQALKATLESDPPYGAHVRFEGDHAPGWNAPATEPWLQGALHRASETYFGQNVAHYGEGGSIPFMAMLGERFPRAQFVITGVLGPHSNAHGPNEFLHIPTTKKVTACVASVLRDHATRAD